MKYTYMVISTSTLSAAHRDVAINKAAKEGYRLVASHVLPKGDDISIIAFMEREEPEAIETAPGYPGSVVQPC